MFIPNSAQRSFLIVFRGPYTVLVIKLKFERGFNFLVFNSVPWGWRDSTLVTVHTGDPYY